ncbi:hypothetical protein J6590_086265 [Homalodisca vitripennis]|nr:hypothetical protein J6590_086265 [Homalodisca vitripennis]
MKDKGRSREKELNDATYRTRLHLSHDLDGGGQVQLEECSCARGAQILPFKQINAICVAGCFYMLGAEVKAQQSP